VSRPLCRPAILLVGIVALQELIHSNNAHTLHFSMDRFHQFLKQDFDFFIGGIRIVSGSRDLGANLSNAVVESTCRRYGHAGRARSKDAGIS
jgi:hypothetical protein